jgi:hypothetical protein
MKKLILLNLLLICILTLVIGQTNQPKMDPVGKWKFEANSTQGYQGGFVNVTLAEKNYNVTMTMADTVNKLIGYNVKYENDTFGFVLYLESTTVSISLKFDGADKMTGWAYYSDGEAPLTLNRVKD